MKPLTDKQKELFENLWGDLRAMYQRDVAMADNGIPFRQRIEHFMEDYVAVATTDNAPNSPRQVETLVRPTTYAEIQQKREYATCHRLIETLASMCAGSDKVIIEKLTGYLWDEEEAGKIKAA
jgi:hypothetical protein